MPNPSPPTPTAAEPRPYKIPSSVLVVIYRPDLQVLLMERADKPGFWQSVTGSMDTSDEPIRETCIREVAEETGIVIGSAQVPASALSDWGYCNVYEIYPMWRHRYPPGVTQNTEHVFGLEVPVGTAVTLAPREHLQFVWCPWQEAAERCFSPSNGDAIRRLAARRGGEQ